MLHEFCLFQMHGNDANHLGEFGINERIELKQTFKKKSWEGVEWIRLP